MIIDYNSSNEVAFLQSNLGSYSVMTLDINLIEKYDNPISGSQNPTPREEITTQLIDSMVANL